MNRTCEQLDQTLMAAAVGRFDALGLEQIALLETHLNECARCAERLAGSTPAVDAALRFTAPAPSAAQWAQVWNQIDAAALTTRRSQPTMRGQGVWRWARLAAVAAAGVLLVGFWKSVLPADSRTAVLRLARNTEIHDLETFGDQTPFVVSLDDANGSSVIWMLDPNEGA